MDILACSVMAAQDPLTVLVPVQVWAGLPIQYAPSDGVSAEVSTLGDGSSILSRGTGGVTALPQLPTLCWINSSMWVHPA